VLSSQTRPSRRRRAPSAPWALAALVCALAVTALALRPDPIHVAGSSLLSHVAAFGVVTFLACTALWPPRSDVRPRLVAVAVVLGTLLLFGVGIEVAQALMGDSRAASRRDVVADALGVLAGYAAWATWWITATPER
jgi:VanZ family protein